MVVVDAALDDVAVVPVGLVVVVRSECSPRGADQHGTLHHEIDERLNYASTVDERSFEGNDGLAWPFVVLVSVWVLVVAVHGNSQKAAMRRRRIIPMTSRAWLARIFFPSA